MPSGTKTLLVFEDGSTLMTSPGGDLYWVQNPAGTSTPCSLQQASLCWMQYEDSLAAPDQVGQPTAAPQLQQTGYVSAQTMPAMGRAVSAGSEDGHEYTPWQRELLDKLGLTADEMDPTGTMKKKKKDKKNKD